ncbi:MAG: RNA-binding domain-containing protein [Candidatus Nitrosocaldus sp.]
MKKIGSVFTSVEVGLIVHATESLDKIIDALSSTLGIRSSILTKEILNGHHGNEIVLLKGSVVGDDARNLADRLMGSLSSEDLLRIYKDFDLYTDNRSSFYVRISKQEMVKGRIRLSQSDAVRIRLKIARQMHKASLEEFRSALVGSDEV